MFRVGVGLLVLASIAPLPAAAGGRSCGPAMVQVVVLDQGGNALSGLAPADFKVHIKNQSANVSAVDYGIFPHRTLLLISRTSTMGQSIKMELARQMAAAIVAVAPGEVIAGTYGADVSGFQDARTSQALGSDLDAGSDSHNVLYDAMFVGMANAQLHRGDALVVFTDSPDNGSTTTLTDLQQRIAANGVRVFVVALPPSTDTGNMKALADVAEYSGGAVLVPLRVEQTTQGIVISADQVEGAVGTLNRAYTQYSNIYQLETNSEGQDKPLALKVDVDRHKIGAGRVLAPAMLAPCSAIAQ